MKVSARLVEELVFACDPDREGCGWQVTGYADGGYLYPLEEPK